MSTAVGRTTERDRPPPRRKSCLACVRSKRRCNQRLPACSRCMHRMIACEYPGRPSHSKSGTTTQESAADTTSASRPPQSALCNAGRPQDECHVGQDDGGEGGVADAGEMGLDLFQSQLHGHGDEALHQWFRDEPSRCADDSAILAADRRGRETTLDDLQILRSDAAWSEFDFELPLARSPSTNGDISNRLLPLNKTARVFRPEQVRRVIEKKMSYALDKLKSAPAQMLLEVQTPWCHGSLYADEMPRAIEGRYYICGIRLYSIQASGHVD